MKIDILTVDGSPKKVTERTIYGDSTQIGVGGAELALLTMCRQWHEMGYDVTLYNDPRDPNASEFKQKYQNEFNPQENRDILIQFRGPNSLANDAKGKKVWWSTDQFTIGDYRKLASECEKIVVISPFHARYFKDTYGIDNSIVIDLPVRVQDYARQVDKDLNNVIFCSIPDRGLVPLSDLWKVISDCCPDAKLNITSDWRLWDPNFNTNQMKRYRLLFAGLRNVEYHSAVNRLDLIDIQLRSAIHLYPCTYDELFCISVAETQFAGCVPVTTTTGALETTNMGFKSNEMDKLIEETVRLLRCPEQHQKEIEITRKNACERFNPAKIADMWDALIFND